MCGHIVGPFEMVTIPLDPAARSEDRDRVLKVKSYVWISVLLKGE